MNIAKLLRKPILKNIAKVCFCASQFIHLFIHFIIHLNRVSNDTIVINIVEATVKKYIFAG